MSLNKYLIIFFCSLLFITCKRKGTVSGKVTNVFDNSPVQGIDVRVTQSAELDPSTKALQVGTTDVAGNFKINATYNTRVTYEYFISIAPESTYDTKEPFAVKDTTSDISKIYLYYTTHYRTLTQDILDVKKSKGNQNFEFNVAPCGRLRIIARNVAPASETDKIEVSVVDKNLADGLKNVFTGTGVNPPSGSYLKAPTNGTITLKWVVSGGSSPQSISYDTIPLLPYTKQTYYINY